MQAQFVSGSPVMVDHTPDADVAAGQVLVIGETCRIAHLPIASGELGALAAGGGLYKVTCLDGNGIEDGTKVYWDDASNGVTQDITAGGVPFGFAAEDGVYNGTFNCVHNPAVS